MSTLQVGGDEEKEQHRNQTARRGLEDSSLRTVLGSRRKTQIWKWERNEAMLPTARSVKGRAVAFGYGRRVREVPREAGEGHVPRRTDL